MTDENSKNFNCIDLQIEYHAMAINIAPSELYLRLFIFDSVGLIYDNVSPVKLLKGGLLLEDHFVRGDHHVPLSGHNLFTDDTALAIKYTNSKQMHKGSIQYLQKTTHSTEGSKSRKTQL